MEGLHGLHMHDSVDRPPTQGLTNQKIGTIERGKRIGDDTNHTMANTPVGIAVVSSGIELLRKGSTSVGVGREIQVMRPGVADLAGYLVVSALAQHNRQRIVVGVRIILNLPNFAKKLIRTPCVECSRCSRSQRRIVIEAPVQVKRTRSKIF